MKNVFFAILSFIFMFHDSFAQDKVLLIKDTIVTTDSSKTSVPSCYKNIVSIGGKYYLQTLNNTRTTLSDNGFILDQEAFEYQIRFYNLPKVFYYQQLGTLSNTNYVSVTGIGLKEDIRFPVFKNSNFIFTPYIEVGGGFYRMNIAKGVKSNTISSVLNSQVENHSLDNFVASGDVGIDLGYRFKVEDKTVSILVNGGYISNFPTEWRLASSLAFKEKINLASPYAGVTIRLDLNCTDACCVAK